MKTVRRSGHRYELRERKHFETKAEKKVRKHKNFIRKLIYTREGERYRKSKQGNPDFGL